MIKFTKKSHISGVGSPNYLGGAYNVKLDGSNLLASGFSDGSLSIINAADPEALALLGALQGTGDPNYLNGASDIAVFTKTSVKYAAITSFVDNALVIININTPASPSLSDAITGTGSPNYLSGMDSGDGLLGERDCRVGERICRPSSDLASFKGNRTQDQCVLSGKMSYCAA